MRITKSMPVDEWRKYTVIQEGDLGHGPHGDHKNYLIVAMEGKYWYVEYWDDDLYKNSKGGFDEVQGEVVEMRPRLVWVHERAIWGFWGELDDPSMFGNHNNPFLGIFEGTLHEAIQKALTVPNFNSWGGGGIIRPVTVFK